MEQAVYKGPTHAESKAEALAQIQADKILTVWKVSYEQKSGRKWEPMEDHVLSYEAAWLKADYYKWQAERSPNKVRNVKIDCVIVMTHEPVRRS
jgi:hypothetical protein